MKRLPFWKRPYGARRVLDIGSGHNPIHGVTHLLEIDLQEGRERGGQQALFGSREESSLDSPCRN
jgi:hypothetical protein